MKIQRHSPVHNLQKSPKLESATREKTAEIKDKYEGTSPTSSGVYKPDPALLAASARQQKAQNEWKTRMECNERYSGLAPEKRAQLDKLAANSPGAQEALTKLVNSGRVEAKDQAGKTIMDHLQKYQESKVPDGFDKEKGLRDLVTAVADPGTIRQGDNRSACAQTTVEYIAAQDHPADYVRNNVELLTKGKTVMANGQTMPLNPTGLVDDGSHRGLHSIVYQASLSDYANGDKIGYDNGSQFHGRSGERITSTTLDGQPLNCYAEILKDVDPAHPTGEPTTVLVIDGKTRTVYSSSIDQPQHGGFTDEQAQKAMNAISGKETVIQGKKTVSGSQWVDDHLVPDSMKQRKLANDINASLEKGETVYVAISWDKDPKGSNSRHALAVEKVENGVVYLRNPWGDGEKGGGEGTPKRTVVDEQGRITMSLEDFHTRFQARMAD